MTPSQDGERTTRVTKIEQLTKQWPHLSDTSPARNNIIDFLFPIPKGSFISPRVHWPALLPMPSLAYPVPTDISPVTVKNTASLFRIVTLALISGAAIASRLFSIINYESVIHEL